MNTTYFVSFVITVQWDKHIFGNCFYEPVNGTLDNANAIALLQQNIKADEGLEAYGDDVTVRVLFYKRIYPE